MNLLALETATSACSVALSTADACVGRHAIVEQRHTECLFEMIDETLAEAGVARTALDAVAFGIGPGSFTGVRVAAATAQGIAAARNLPVVGISTLAVLAATATGAEGGAVLAALDARRGEVYVAAYE
ncbi:MAG: tRNA (adenosine(37)-N6)-threonylcarbamoyltransferase complex dimerization subunit type 1 TsaB, partial [Gammaproteobacteria bacterium]